MKETISGKMPRKVKSKEEVSRSGAHKTKEVYERNIKKLKGVGKMSAKTKESSLLQDV